MTFLLLVLVSAVCALAVAGIARRWSAAGAGPPSAREAAREAGEAVRRRHGPLAARLDPAVATGLALTLAGVAIVIGGVLVGVLAYLVRRHGELVEIDRSVARWGRDHGTPFSDWCLNAVTHLGEPRVVIALAALLAIEETIRTRSRWVVPFVAVVVAGNGVLTTLVKQLADRVRPEFDPIAATLGPSFPSGHSSWSMAFWAAAALLLSQGRPRNVRVAIFAAAAALIVLVAGSRVLLSVHWLSDVLAGLALGAAWFSVCAIAFGGRVLRFGAAAETAEREAARPRPARAS
jgi:membrane-associated phospholipid phosphatase